MVDLQNYVLERLRPMNLADRKELAVRAGVSFWTINKYAYGQIREPSGAKLQRLADALHAREAA